ncbi:MAG TPA: ATP cone domain-containing protein [Prolixibacteraceae bacterium]|nr:ATP cone domain-containing protein [Prolixibacteraceae bacterium]
MSTINNTRDIKNVMVRKASGEEEKFSTKKLIASLERAGADFDVIDHIVNDVHSWIFDGVTTRKIYDRAFSLLRSNKFATASRYGLKKAILEMGPTGYPFEHLISRVMELGGYSTQTGIVVDGFCVTHEVDVIATKNKQQVLVECKYGQSAGRVVSVKVPLYIHSRVNDIIRKRQTLPEFEGFSFQGCIATNTRFTTDAIDYAKCNNMWLLAWDYPVGQGLKDIIDRERIYPITVLNNLNKAQKQQLMEVGVVVCRQIHAEPKVLDSLQLTSRKLSALLNEVKNICG